ncbi:hypothetical protein [Streptomyces hiroshimensis]|uniref:ATP synthase protein I n=1 Tax=Streptomyces hiroshimensis TaxID=66424 RepID=A0ABQ2YFW8_9ACTN|nr:hypothetical protein [Streptomyces hiroshimensis]GGX82331.1 ATP synthase protein I [Streptomyces hiroshimensis]
MQSNDARTLMQCAVPTVVAGIVAAAVSGVLAGGKGALGAVVGTLVAGGVMAMGLFVLQRTAKSFPHLFQAMGLVLYVTQFLIAAVVLAVFRDTSLFNTRAFAFALLGAVLVWTAAQTRAYLKAKILYVDPESVEAKKSAPAGSPT